MWRRKFNKKKATGRNGYDVGCQLNKRTKDSVVGTRDAKKNDDNIRRAVLE